MISLSGTTILATAPAGSVIGRFNQPVVLDPEYAGLFEVHGVVLTTAWQAPPAGGIYALRVRAFRGAHADFQIAIIGAPQSEPAPA